MIVGFVALALASQALASQITAAKLQTRLVEPIQYYRRAPVHPPPCGNGWDLSARDGMCYPNGYLPPQEQAARQGYYAPGRRYGRYPVPCGNGADVDIRDGQCYPTGTVPYRYQDRPHYRY
jgi:hypothetical protein